MTTRSPSAKASIIQVEANLLCFPFFALQTKGLKQRKGVEVTGVRNGESFRLRVTRNTDSEFPGPLSRKLHFALLSLLFDRHHAESPIQNPIEFSWRELADRADLEWGGGHMIPRLKRAIEATHGVVIRTNHALITRDQSDRKPMPTRERGYHLYEKYAFVNEVLADGSVADKNHLWLADWYLANLNSLYSGPVNYDLWRELNRRPIASRIYEYLLFKFTADIPKLMINYQTLAPFLPVRVEPRLSWARKQLDPAISDLVERGVVTRVDWTESRDGKIQLHFIPGPALKREHSANRRCSPSNDSAMEQVTVRELPYSESPTERLVRSFHRLWSGTPNHHPAKSELKFAEQLIGEYGVEELDAVMKHVVRTMKTEFPNARTFSATARYIPAVIEQRRRDEKSRLTRQSELEQQQVDDAEHRKQKSRKFRRRDELLAKWRELSVTDREQIRQAAVAAIPYDVLRRIESAHTDLTDPRPCVLDYFSNQSTGSRQVRRR